MEIFYAKIKVPYQGEDKQPHVAAALGNTRFLKVYAKDRDSAIAAIMAKYPKSSFEPIYDDGRRDDDELKTGMITGDRHSIMFGNSFGFVSDKYKWSQSEILSAISSEEVYNGFIQKYHDTGEMKVRLNALETELNKAREFTERYIYDNYPLLGEGYNVLEFGFGKNLEVQVSESEISSLRPHQVIKINT